MARDDSDNFLEDFVTGPDEVLDTGAVLDFDDSRRGE